MTLRRLTLRQRGESQFLRKVGEQCHPSEGLFETAREFWEDESASWRMKVSSTFDQEVVWRSDAGW